MSDQKKLLPHVHAVMGDVQMPVVKATVQDVEYIAGFRGDLPFLHATTADGKAQVPVVKVLGGGDGPGPGGDSIQEGNGIKITEVGDKKVISTVVPISKKGGTGKHRYWRWDILSSVDPAGPRIRAHRIRAANGAGENIVFAQGSVSSSSETTTDKAYYLFRDGDTQVGWATQVPAPGWVSVDTDSNPVEISSFFVQRLNSYTQAAPDEITLSFSDDGATWTEVARAKLVYDAANKSQLVVVSSDQDIPAFIGEAPEDGKAYVRKDGGWEIAPQGGGLDVPSLPLAGVVTDGDLLPVAQSADTPAQGWRINVSRGFAADNLGSTGAVYVYEVEFREVPGGAKHPNGTLTSSGASSGNSAFDGNVATNASSTAGAASFILGQQYGSAVKVSEVAIYCPSSQVAKDKFPAVFTVEKRDTASGTWEVVASFDLLTGGTAQLPDGGWMSFDVSDPDSINLNKLPAAKLAEYVLSKAPDTTQGDGIKVTQVGKDFQVSTEVPITKMASAGAHKYWRLRVISNNGHSLTAVRTLRLFDSQDQQMVITAADGSAFASNNMGDRPPMAAFIAGGDGWESTGGMPVSLGFNFNEPKEVTAFQVVQLYAPERPVRVEFQFSDDGTNYTSVGEEITLTYASTTSQKAVLQTFPVPAFIGDAPNDNELYGRKGGQWVRSPNPKIIEAGQGVNVRDLGDRVEISTKVPLTVREQAGAHKYWRWVFPTTQNIIYMDRIAMYDETDTLIPVSINNATVTASSSHNQTYPENAFYDSENEGRWRSAAGGSLPHWLQVEFNQKIEVAKFTLRVVGAHINIPFGVVLQYSDNGYFWVDAFEDLSFGYSGSNAGPFIVSDAEKPAYIPIPPKDGKLYGVRNGEAMEIPQLGQGGRTYGAFVNYDEREIVAEKRGIEMQWGTAGIPPEGRIYRISCVLAIDGELGAEVGISFSELQASMLRVKATYTAPDGSMGTRVITEPDGQLVVILGLEKTLIVLEGTMIDTTFHPSVLNMQIQLIAGAHAKVMKGTLATLVDVGELTLNG
ncbi:hypothetical protein JT27_18400 [Alcaligenes faecalis]|uniref:discoidin domain-containing protein n=1 Tax=Alcaligenes faecalis TaxID=511 RepID=UPI00052B5C04|nr:discoidin domain-containing protein [Alcaligenes faecalis]KGP00301.1 hypothetical protein JT27_18400 [Alcaligenes faecalis]